MHAILISSVILFGLVLLWAIPPGKRVVREVVCLAGGTACFSLVKLQPAGERAQLDVILMVVGLAFFVIQFHRARKTRNPQADE